MSVVMPPSHGKSWMFQVTALCIVLGVLMALSLRTQHEAASQGVPLHMPDVRATLRITKEENLKLETELTESKKKNEELAKQQAKGLSSTKNLENSLNEAKLLAGTVPVVGSGVTVTIHDSPKLDPSENRDMIIQNYLVHDSDIRNVVNELFASGAEAISVGEQRIVSNSSIRCIGAVILVNRVELTTPIVIKAIGKSDVLEGALNLPGGVADQLFLYDMIEVKKESAIVVHEYKGTTGFNYARPLTGKTAE